MYAYVLSIPLHVYNCVFSFQALQSSSSTVTVLMIGVSVGVGIHHLQTFHLFIFHDVKCVHLKYVHSSQSVGTFDTICPALWLPWVSNQKQLLVPGCSAIQFEFGVQDSICPEHRGTGGFLHSNSAGLLQHVQANATQLVLRGVRTLHLCIQHLCRTASTKTSRAYNIK